MATEAYVLFSSQNLAKNSYLQAFRIKNTLLKIPLMKLFVVVVVVGKVKSLTD